MTNFLDWLTVYEHEKQIMKIVKATRKKTTIATRRRSKMHSRSNVLKKIIESLENEQYLHMLYWDRKEEKEFIIKFVHMNNPQFKNADYLELFKELDKLSSSYEKYLQDEKYMQLCKVRCKSNLKKLVESRALTFMGETKQGKSIVLRKYKLNFDVSSVKSAISKGRRMKKQRKIKGFSGCETVKGITYVKGKLKFENQLNEQSHCLCLSNCNSVSVYVTLPFGAASVSNTNLVGPTLLDTYCTTANKNEDSGNLVLAIQPLTVYEHEKQMDGNNDALHIVSVEDTDLFRSSYSSCVKNDKCELTECIEPDPKIQHMDEIQNVGAVSTNYTEGLSVESVGNYLFPNCNGPFKAMEALNIDGENYTSLGCNELTNTNNPPVEFQNESFQDMDFGKNSVQMVPTSPQNFDGIFNDSLCQWHEECKPLQRDKDPFWFGTNPDCLSNNQHQENDNLMAENEDWFPFENMYSSDAV